MLRTCYAHVKGAATPRLGLLDLEPPLSASDGPACADRLDGRRLLCRPHDESGRGTGFDTVLAPAVPRSDVRVTPGAYSLTPRTVALSDRSAPTTQVSLQPKVRNSASVRNLNKLTYIVINCHKKTFVHLLSSGMAHKSLHTVLWRCAVNEAPRLVTCFDIVTEGLRSYCGARMRGYAAIRATTYWPAQRFAAPLRLYDNVSNC
jgi:hypothetical protein